jgi:NAD(P)-dependent dehydrogenase (short-subunit alcohol dehydrogenase family)
MATDPANHRFAPIRLRKVRAAVVATVLLGLALAQPACLDADQVDAAADRQVILVTGSTDGLGRAVALRLASTGAHIIVHGRNAERGRQVVEAIAEEGVGSARFYAADFASLDQVRDFARTILNDYDRLDILINNAGIGPGPPGENRRLSADGNELKFQVNYLAGFLLTRTLLPLLRESAPARIINVSSRNQQPIDFTDLDMEAQYSGGLAYGRSKLAQILFTLDLAEELEGTGVVVNAVHPAGAMDTNLVRETGSTPQTEIEEGVRSVLLQVTTPAPTSGIYFHQTERGTAHEQAHDPRARERLRALSLELTGLR